MLSSSRSLDVAIFNRCRPSSQVIKVDRDDVFVDLTVNKNLKGLDLINCEFAVLACLSQLTRLVLCEYEIHNETVGQLITSAKVLNEVGFIGCKLMTKRNASECCIDLSKCEHLSVLNAVGNNFAVCVHINTVQILTLGIANIKTRESANVVGIIRDALSLKVLILIGCREMNQIRGGVSASDLSWDVALSTSSPFPAELFIETNELHKKTIYLSGCLHLKELYLLESGSSLWCQSTILKHVKILRFNPTSPYILSALYDGKQVGDLSSEDLNKDISRNPNNSKRDYLPCTEQTFSSRIDISTSENQPLLKVCISKVADKIVCMYNLTEHNSDRSYLLAMYTLENCALQKVSNVEADILSSYLSNPLNLVEVTVGQQEERAVQGLYD